MSPIDSTPSAHKPPNEIVWLVCFSVFMLAGLALVSVDSATQGYSIFNRTWGFDHLKFYAWPIKIAAFVVVLLFLIPATSHRLRAFLHSKFVNRFPRRLSTQLIWSLCLSVAFYFLQVKYYFLGDFNIRMQQCMKGDYVGTEYLTMWGLHHLAMVFAKIGIGTESFFKLYSVACGFLYTLIATKMAIAMSEQTLRRWLIFFTLISTSSLLLFCGYVEIYATPAVLLLLFSYACVRYLHGNTKFTTPLILWFLALASHFIAIAALPALLSLLYFKGKLKLSRFRNASPVNKAVLLLVLAVLGTAAIYYKGHPFLMTLKAPRDVPSRMTLFSVSHVWEFLNGQVLSSGLAIFVVIVLFVYALVKSISIRALTAYFLLLSAGFLLLTFVSDLQRGSGDWDIMSFTAVPLNLSALLVILDVYKQNARTAQYISSILLVVNVVNAAFWLQINHSDRSIQKIKSMLSGDPASYYDARISGNIQLALCFRNNKLFSEEEKMALKTCNESRKEDVGGCVIYLQRLMSANRTDEAVKFAEELLEQRSAAIYEHYLYLLPYFEKTNNNEKILYFLNKLFDAFIAQPNAFLYSTNFKQETMLGLFKTLYKYGGEAMSEKRRDLLAQTIRQFEQYKFVQQR